ncbi:MAG: methionine--tRNA ligase [Gemmatimonadota bacterium]|nr:MAG: methionine--tRNA ligase [Gemmatimonadota bacterium]
MSRFYITTAIDYSNGDPHLGHAFEKIGADAIARYRRLRGDEVHFVIGMDEHSQTILQPAAEAGLSPQAWVDRMASVFSEAWEGLRISHDDFIRTTEERHVRAVVEMVERTKQAGYIFEGTYEGYYCERCETFKQEKDLADGRCPEHPDREIAWTKEDNYFFKLSAFRDPLLKHIDEHPEFVQPEIRRNEIRNVLEEGLQDISVSRPQREWGVPFPGDPDHAVYVWYDALINYLSAVGFPEKHHGDWWPAQLHVIGKGITRHHCIIWPAMLLAAGVELPKTVWAHGYINWEGRKLSKSAGAPVTLTSASERHGPDPLRYFLLREVPWNGDADFTWQRFDDRYNADLANDLGNLANRTLAMIHKYRDGVVPSGEQSDLDRRAQKTLADYREVMDGYLLHQGIAAAMELAGAANVFIEEKAPWKLTKEPSRSAELDTVLAGLARTLARLALLLSPFMPGKSSELWQALGRQDELSQLAAYPELDLAGGHVQRQAVLFPRSES